MSVMEQYEMKTMFDELLKAKKQKLDMCELAIVRANNEIARLLSNINVLIVEIGGIKIPAYSTFSDILKANAFKKSYLSDIDMMHTQISNIKKDIKRLEEEYRLTYIEFEKVKYLQEKKRKEILANLKRKEQKSLDEITTILHKKDSIWAL